jgi:hypothetical protein
LKEIGRSLDKLWTKQHEQVLEQQLSKNEGLRELFEQYPEKKELYKLKILDSEVTEAPSPPNDICCKNCIFQLSPISIGGKMTSRHNWGECKMFNSKPYEVLYEHARCEFCE